MLRHSIKFVVLLIFLTQAKALAQMSFTKDSTSVIYTDGGRSLGSSWADYDNDGDLDLFVANSEADFVYVNNGRGSFTRDNQVVIATHLGTSFSSSWGDYDNDGDPDLFVTRDGINNLYRNNGDHSFLRLPGDLSGSGDDAERAAAWADYDNDGDLDLLVTHFLNNILYENLGDEDGDGKVDFRQDRRIPIFTDVGNSSGCSWADYDNDGDLDLFVANNFASSDHLSSNKKNFLYENKGVGVFVLITSGAIVEAGGFSRGGSWGDYDNDGDLDLFVTNSGGDNLYQNNGDGSFTAVITGAIVEGGSSRGSSWGDFDNDGDLDLFVTRGNGADNVLYENEGTPEGTGQVTFTRVTEGAIVNDGGSSRTTSSADIDNDGFMDIFVSNWIEGVLNDGEPQPNFLYLNDGNINNWINIRCVGTFSNRSAIGTKVRIKATIGGKPVWQLREISGQTGYYTQNSLRAAFGLGDATLVDSIKIEWPTGRDQVLTNIEENQFLIIEEAVPIADAMITNAVSGTDVVIDVQDTVGTISEVIMEYRAAGSSGFSKVSMANQSAGLFQANIPAEFVTPNGVDYRIVATDNAGGSFGLPTNRTYSIRVNTPEGISEDLPREHGSAQNSYRIYSVPLELDSRDPADLLIDDLGEYDMTRWRFADFDPLTNTNVEFPNISAIQSGKGYWFLVSEPARVIDTGAGTSHPTHEDFAISLEPGWNLVGNPFAYTIPLTNLRLKSGNTVVLRTYKVAWNDPIRRPVEEIIPFEGYAINNITSAKDTLSINPFIPPTGLSKLAVQNRISNSISWSIRILAHCQEARDEDNVLGISKNASMGPDNLDYPEPPPVGEYVSVSFHHDEWGLRSRTFSTDFRPAISDKEVWEFEVKSNIREQVKLTFADIEDLPEEYGVILVDEGLNITQNLRTDNQFIIASPGVEYPKRLKIIVGRGDVIEQDISAAQKIPSDYELSQNFPNPFNPSTTIRFGLPEPGRVTLKVFNIIGNEVATLVNDEQKSAGYHVAIWDGRSHSGKRAASGIYFVRMQGEDFIQMRKMALVY